MDFRIKSAVLKYRQVQALRLAETFAADELSKAITALPPGTMQEYVKRTDAVQEEIDMLEGQFSDSPVAEEVT